jgi:hypothetical protein
VFVFLLSDRPPSQMWYSNALEPGPVETDMWSRLHAIAEHLLISPTDSNTDEYAQAPTNFQG